MIEGENDASQPSDQREEEDEIGQYLQRYGLSTAKEAAQAFKFTSNSLYRSYIFTYHIGYDLLEKLFRHGDRLTYARRLMEEPVTPSLVRQWIAQPA